MPIHYFILSVCVPKLGACIPFRPVCPYKVYVRSENSVYRRANVEGKIFTLWTDYI